MFGDVHLKIYIKKNKQAYRRANSTPNILGTQNCKLNANPPP